MLQTRLWTDVYKTLMLDVVAPEAHQNDSSYVSELSGPTFNPLHKNFAGWAFYMEDLKKLQNCQNWGVGACAGMGTYPGQYGS